MPNPLPYYPFNVDDWDSSSSVRAMKLFARGLYHGMLNIQWRDGSVPDDPYMVARILGLDAEDLEEVLRYWDCVRSNFAPDPDDESRIINPRQDSERRKVCAKVALLKENGSKGGRPKAIGNQKLTKSKPNARIRASESVSESSSFLPESRARLPLDVPAVARDTNPRTGLANSVESEFSELAEGMYQQHPKAKDWPLVPAAMLRALERANGDGELIRYVHGLWCKTEAWRESNARYCPALPKWLDDRGWEQIPDEYDYQYRKWLSERKQKNEQAQSIRNGSGR